MKHGPRFFRRSGVGVAALVAAALLTLGACSNPIARLTTERAISNSVGGVLAQPGVNLRISLGLTPQQLQQAAQTLGGKDSALSPKLASTIASTAVVINFHSGHGESLQSAQARTDRANQFDFALQVGSDSPIQLRYLNGAIYARADVATLLSDFGQDPAQAASFQHALQAANAYVPGLADLGQGKWVSAQTSAFSGLLNGLKSKLPASNSGSSSQLLNQLRAAFKSNASYSNAGTHGGRTEYLVTVAAHNFVQQVASTLPASITSIPGASNATKAITGLANRIPANQTVVMQLWVRNNKAQEVDLDLNQFEHKLPFAAPLRIQFGSAVPITAPQGATSLDLSRIAGLLGGLLGGSSSSSSSAAPAA